MRVIIQKGKALRTLSCPGCGQIEKQTEDESDLCLNCGTPMNIIPDKELPVSAEVPPAAAKEAEAEETEKVECPQECRKRKRGPKKKGCQTCEKAMATLNNRYTCKETMELRHPEDICDRWVKGIPVGDAG